MAGATLRVVASDSEKGACAGKAHEFKTTAEGAFYGPPVRTFDFFMFVMAHSFFPWAVCTNREGTWVPLHQDRTYTLVDTGPVFLVEMTCQDMKCEAKENWEPSPELIKSLEARNE